MYIKCLPVAESECVAERGLRHKGNKQEDESQSVQCFLGGEMLSCFSCVRLSLILWNTDRQAPLSIGLSKHEYWSELSFPSPGYLSVPGLKPTSPKSLALAGRFLTTSTTWEVPWG